MKHNTLNKTHQHTDEGYWESGHPHSLLRSATRNTDDPQSLARVAIVAAAIAVDRAVVEAVPSALDVRRMYILSDYSKIGKHFS